MIMSLTKLELIEYVGNQLEHFFPDKNKFIAKDIAIAMDRTLEKLEYCFQHTNFRHYSKNGQANFQHLYSDQYSQFLYVLARELWCHSRNKPICDKLVMLNKSLNGLLCPYTVKLPDIFLFLHPIGTVIGNANFSDYLVIAQSVTINNSIGSDGKEQLNIGKGAFFSAGCKIVGFQPIGDYVSIGTNTIIHNREIPDNSIIYTDCDGVIKIKKRKKDCTAQKFFYKFLEDR